MGQAASVCNGGKLIIGGPKSKVDCMVLMCGRFSLEYCVCTVCAPIISTIVAIIILALSHLYGVGSASSTFPLNHISDTVHLKKNSDTVYNL